MTATNLNEEAKERKLRLLDRMIGLYGLEYPATVEFAWLIERNDISLQHLELIVKAHESTPIEEED